MPHSIRRSPRLSIHPAGPPHLSVNNSPLHHPLFNVTCLSDSYATQARSRIECVTVRLDSFIQIRTHTRRLRTQPVNHLSLSPRAQCRCIIKSQDPKPTPQPAYAPRARGRSDSPTSPSASIAPAHRRVPRSSAAFLVLDYLLSMVPGTLAVTHTVPAIPVHCTPPSSRPITHLYINTGFLVSCAITQICRCDGRRHGCPTWKQQVPPSWPGHCRQL
jgi:hypothetical protein